MKINLREGRGNSDILTIVILISRLRFIVVSPRLLHRWSIVSMEDRWSNDGQTMEYLRRKSGELTEEDRMRGTPEVGRLEWEK